MKIIAFGDIHGETLNLIKLAPEIATADKVVFVGDGANSLKVLDAAALGKLLAVRGNCDFFSGLPSEVIDNGIFVTHGEDYGVKAGLTSLVAAAQRRGAKLCFFGHNHNRSHDVIDSITFVNPGTLGNSRTGAPGSYAVVLIEGDKFKVDFFSVGSK